MLSPPGESEQDEKSSGSDSAAGDGESPVEPVPRTSAEVVLGLDACGGDSCGVSGSRRMEREEAEYEAGYNAVVALVGFEKRKKTVHIFDVWKKVIKFAVTIP